MNSPKALSSDSIRRVSSSRGVETTMAMRLRWMPKSSSSRKLSAIIMAIWTEQNRTEMITGSTGSCGWRTNCSHLRLWSHPVGQMTNERFYEMSSLRVQMHAFDGIERGVWLVEFVIAVICDNHQIDPMIIWIFEIGFSFGRRVIATCCWLGVPKT